MLQVSKSRTSIPPSGLQMAFYTHSYSIRKKIITIFLQKKQRADVKSRQTAGAGGDVLF